MTKVNLDGNEIELMDSLEKGTKELDMEGIFINNEENESNDLLEDTMTINLEGIDNE